MRVEVNEPESVAEPRFWQQHRQVLAMALRPGSIEVGLRRSEMKRATYNTGEMRLLPRMEKWVRTDDLHYLSIAFSDAALTAACDGARGEIELRRVDRLIDARVGALVAAVNADRVTGFQSGRLFLDSVEQALAVALVQGYAFRRPSPQKYREGLTPARLRRITELVHSKIDEELTLGEMAQSVELSKAHFSRIFRKSMGVTPYQFVLRLRVERAKTMLRSADSRILDVAVACGFKTQQHFARVFRYVCGTSPTEYRHEFLRHGASCDCEVCSRATSTFTLSGSVA